MWEESCREVEELNRLREIIVPCAKKFSEAIEQSFSFSVWNCRRRYKRGVPFEVNAVNVLDYVNKNHYDVFQKHTATSDFILVKWRKRRVPLIINIDASFYPGTKKGGAGLLFRTGDGRYYAECSVDYREGLVDDSTECEALALLHAVQLVDQLGLSKKIVIETDSLLVTAYFSDWKVDFGDPLSQATKVILNQVAADMVRLSEKTPACSLSVEFTYREANEGADKLARHAAYGHNTAMYIALPPFLEVPLFEDSTGIKRVRAV